MELNEYFQVYHQYFWQWEEEGRVIAIPGDKTIAYREYIVELLERLSLQGLPNFGTILLALIATNPNGDKSLEAVKAIVNVSSEHENTQTLLEALTFLGLLSELPKEYKNGQKRILLLQAIFEGSHNNLSLKKSKILLDNYIGDRYGAITVMVPKPFSQVCLYRDIRPLSLLFDKFKDVNSILEKMASLPQIPEKILEDEAPETKHLADRDLIEELIEHNSSFHVGALVKHIWSGLNIPVHARLPSAQPLGGVSDLTNKGDFDKLLISEFANDDLVFLSRLANNEALYILREIPPASNKVTRTILIDVSLKNWGTPKTVAFAIAVAIATHPKTTITCNAYVVGNSFHAISLDTVHGIIDGLQILDAGLNGAKGLEAYFKEFPPDKNREVFLITEPSTLKQTAMLKAVNDFHAAINYWIYNDSEGNIDIYKKQQSSKKQLQHIKLPLQQLWQREIKTKKIPARTEEQDYPILFRKSMSPRKLVSTSDKQVFEITNYKSVLRHYDSTAANRYEKGWELVWKQLPLKGDDYEIGLLQTGEYVLLMFHISKREIYLFSLTTGQRKILAFPSWRSLPKNGFIFHENEFHFVDLYKIWSINPITEVIEVHQKDYRPIYDKRMEELATNTNGYYGSVGLFKNVNEIYINEFNSLVFNKHELTLSSYKHIFLSKNRSFIKKRVAARLNDTEFTFEDGSSVEVHASGMLTLKSSKESIPYIYIPTVISSSLGVATQSDFSGNEYYYKEPFYEVVLTDAGNNKLEVIRMLKDLLGVGLAEGKSHIDTTPSVLISFYLRKKAFALKESLEKIGATIELKAINDRGVKQKIVTPELFFKNYIEEFIKTILTHGAAH